MFRKFVPKVGKLNFQDVAKKEGLKDFKTDKFKKRAAESLHKAGLEKDTIQGILSGHKKVEEGTLKKVFKSLNKDKIIKKSGTAVTEYVKAEKGRQTRIYNTRMALRADEIKAEKVQEENKTKDQAPDKKKPSNQPGMSYDSMGHVAKLKSEAADQYAQQPGQVSASATPPIQTEPDPEIKVMIEEAEKHDLPID